MVKEPLVDKHVEKIKTLTTYIEELNAEYNTVAELAAQQPDNIQLKIRLNLLSRKKFKTESEIEWLTNVSVKSKQSQKVEVLNG
jgi:phage terminase large subunit-like protein